MLGFFIFDTLRAGGTPVRRQMPLWTFGSTSTNRNLGLIAALLSVSASLDVMVQIGAS